MSASRTTAVWAPPAHASWVDEVNALGRNLTAPEVLLPIERSSLLAAATAAAGSDDFGDDSWREPFDVLLEAIEREAGLNTVGRLLTRAELLRVLRNRLRVVATRKVHPEIASGAVPQPIVITGTARSGTSILFECLAQDPRLRAPATWEAFDSVPPPETATYTTDPRIAATDSEVALWHAITPAYRSMHANAGGAPNECIFLMAHAFASEHFSGVLDVPTYARWLASRDRVAAFRFHREMLQLLQWRCPGAHWLLKAPSHLTMLPDLLAVYPDARIIHTHRDPCKTVPSTISLMATLRLMRRDHLDIDLLAKGMMRGMAYGLDKARKERMGGDVPEAQCLDVQYQELVRDPLRVIAAIYDALGLEWRADVAERIRVYLAARPQGRHGTHRYALEDFGLDRDDLDARYGAYMQHYDVARER